MNSATIDLFLSTRARWFFSKISPLSRARTASRSAG
jgi:hypothetical protein